LHFALPLKALGKLPYFTNLEITDYFTLFQNNLNNRKFGANFKDAPTAFKTIPKQGINSWAYDIDANLVLWRNLLPSFEDLRVTAIR